MKPHAPLPAQLPDLHRGQHDPRRRRDVRDLHRPCSTRHQFLDTLEILLCATRRRFEDLYDHAAQPLLLQPRKRAAGMRMRFEDHLVARGQLQPGGDDRIALGGVAHKGDLRRFRTDKLRGGCSRAREESVAVLRAFLQFRRGRLHRLQRRTACGAEPAGVEVGELPGQRVLRPHVAPECLGALRIVGGQRAWRRSRRGLRLAARSRHEPGGAEGRPT